MYGETPQSIDFELQIGVSRLIEEIQSRKKIATEHNEKEMNEKLKSKIYI